MINYTSSGMRNLKCENAWHVQNNVTTAKFARNLTTNICLLLAMQTSSDLTSKRLSIFLVDLEQVFYEIFLGRKALFHFFKIKVYYTFFTRVISQQCSSSKVMRESSCSENTQKNNLRQFFCNDGGFKTRISF